MYDKIKSKLQTLPATLIQPGWSIAKVIAQKAWDCKKARWNEIVVVVKDMKTEVQKCYKTHIGGGGGPVGGNGALVLG